MSLIFQVGVSLLKSKCRMAEAMELRNHVLYEGLNFMQMGMECISQIVDVLTSVSDYCQTPYPWEGSE